MVATEYSSKLNINSYLITQKILSGGEQASIDLLKLIYYGNDVAGEFVNPYVKSEITEDLYGINVFNFDYIPNVQTDTKTIINVFFDDIKTSNQGMNKETTLCVDILVHRNMEIIKIPYKNTVILGSRVYEIMNKVEKLLNDSKEFQFLGGIKFYQSTRIGIQDKYTGRRVMFKVTNMN